MSRYIILVMALFLCQVSVLESQTSLASLVLTVLDPEERIVTGAVVNLENRESGWRWKRTIENTGPTRLDALAPGLYLLTVEK